MEVTHAGDDEIIVHDVSSLRESLSQRHVKRRPSPLTPLSACKGACTYTPPNHALFDKATSTAKAPPLSRCEEKWYTQPLDHFSFATAETYEQRYFICATEFFNPRSPTIFFYTGNEADVTLYVNATGLMWETAGFSDELSAALLFAEHRYYGKSRPKTMDDETKPKIQRLAHLTSEQALADYAALIRHVTEVDLVQMSAASGDTGASKGLLKVKQIARPFNPSDVAVITFGGSYGGMLSTWMRLKYPHLVAGAIAGSAPVWSFLGEEPAVDPGAFAAGVTYDATAWGGANAACQGNVRGAFRELINIFENGDSFDFKSVTKLLRLCPGSAIKKDEDILTTAHWLQDAFDYLAMGNYPYEDGYILMGDGTLPAFPFRKACSKKLGDATLAKKGRDALIAALADFAGVYYNYSGTLSCFDSLNVNGPNAETKVDTNLWDWQYCTEMFMPSSRDGVRDMFFSQPWNVTEQVKRCNDVWGVTPKLQWADTLFGGRRLKSASNILFSNGALDPWSKLGVMRTTDFNDVLNDKKGMVAIELQNGAHHLDFFWSREHDSDELKQAREVERFWIGKWIKQKRGKKKGGVAVE